MIRAHFRSATILCGLFLLGGCASNLSPARVVQVGHEAAGPWWMRATGLQAGGKLDLKGRSWWSRAQGLKVGEQFLLDENESIVTGDGGAVRPPPAPPWQGGGNSQARLESSQAPLSQGGERGGAARMVVRREKVRNVSREVEAIVWVIDDDEDGFGGGQRGADGGNPGAAASREAASGGRDGDREASRGDGDSDCYVVDYGGDGTVDRMVDYMDANGDNVPDQMDIRYFDSGELRSVWVGVDRDRDGKMWHLQGYEYSHNFFKSDPYGDNVIYMNKFDPQRGEWVPISECPFAFYDTDSDGTSEVAVRISGAPIDYNTGTDPDYANDARRYRGQWSDEMRRMGAVNVRYSFDIDGLSGKEFPLHYDCGFNMVGEVPYEGPGVARFNALRRPPQVTKVIPFERLRQFCDEYPARETGFTWHEQHDDTIAIGDAPDPKLDYRWEGVFWIWERRFMGNTGGPGQKWNVRREWSDKPASRRELYYSEVDRRIHLFGAREGWIEVGHFSGLGRLGEIRMFDSDDDGYFDRWEVYAGERERPVRVTTVLNPRARRLAFDYEQITRFYTREVLPQALAANEQLLAAMQEVLPLEPPAGLAAAMASGTDTERRYAQDIIREMHYQQIRQRLVERANAVLSKAKQDDLRPLKPEQRRQGANSETAWALSIALEKLETVYGQGDYESAGRILGEIGRMQEVNK